MDKILVVEEILATVVLEELNFSEKIRRGGSSCVDQCGQFLLKWQSHYVGIIKRLEASCTRAPKIS